AMGLVEPQIFHARSAANAEVVAFPRLIADRDFLLGDKRQRAGKVLAVVAVEDGDLLVEEARIGQLPEAVDPGFAAQHALGGAGARAGSTSQPARVRHMRLAIVEDSFAGGRRTVAFGSALNNSFPACGRAGGDYNRRERITKMKFRSRSPPCPLFSWRTPTN